jgi:hypothetical protein
MIRIPYTAKRDPTGSGVALLIAEYYAQAGHDLSSISFFQRGTAQEFITFTSRILVERTALGARQSVKEHGSSNTVEEHSVNPKSPHGRSYRQYVKVQLNCSQH